MDAYEEVELKLRIDPDSAAKIRQSDWWRQLGSGTRKRLHSIYFDTPDRRLRQLDQRALHVRRRRLRFNRASLACVPAKRSVQMPVPPMRAKKRREHGELKPAHI